MYAMAVGRVAAERIPARAREQMKMTSVGENACMINASAYPRIPIIQDRLTANTVRQAAPQGSKDELHDGIGGHHHAHGSAAGVKMGDKKAIKGRTIPNPSMTMTRDEKRMMVADLFFMIPKVKQGMPTGKGLTLHQWSRYFARNRCQ